MQKTIAVVCLILIFIVVAVSTTAENNVDPNVSTIVDVDPTILTPQSVSYEARRSDVKDLDQRNQDAIKRFQDYLRIKSVQPKPDYHTAIEFLSEQAKRIGLEYSVQEFVAGKPVFIAKWPGSKPELKSIMLNSHTDVVPVDSDKWTHDPFGAEIVDGKIYARGSQDMKCVGMQYLEAIDRLKQTGFVPTRTIYTVFVPDEEIGGHDGMQALLASDYFKTLNVGFVMDEGLSSVTNKYMVYYGERTVYWIKVIANGPVGHGSMLIKETATEKLARVINRFMEFRATQAKEMEQNNKKLGHVTTINLTYMKAGHSDGESISVNVIPSTAEAAFDIRISPLIDLADFESKLREWTNEEGVTVEYIQKGKFNKPTDITDNNKYWTAFRDACKKMNLDLELDIFPAATDSRFIRGAGLPALGFSPINFTPVLLHDHDEYLSISTYLRGIDIYVEIIAALSNAPAAEDE